MVCKSSPQQTLTFFNRAAIYNKDIILSRHYVSLNLLFEQVLTKLMACQGCPSFLGTKYSDFLHFQFQCSNSVLYDKSPIYSIYY